MLDAVVDYLPIAARRAAGHRHGPADRRRGDALDRSDRAVRGAGLQDRGRPVRRQAGLLPGLLRHAQDRLVRLQLDQGPAGARRPHARRCTPTTARRSTEVSAGDIAAAVGLKNTTTGDTLCAEDKPIVLESITFPEPVIELAIEPKTKADQDKMAIALQRLAEEDPTFRVQHRRGDGPDPHRGHGRAAPRGDRRPHAARVQGAGQRRPAAGRATARRSASPSRPRAASCARPAARASTATSC